MSYSTPGWSARRVVRIPWSQIAPCARIRTAPGWRRARSASPSASGGRPRPAWIRIGTPASSASVKTSSISWPSNTKSCARGCSLMPRCSRRQAALRLVERIFGRVQPAERHQPPIAFPRPGEHPVVGHAIGRVAVGVVQGEHARPARPRVVELREQLRQVERAPVLVEPQVGVGVRALRRPPGAGASPRRGTERERRHRGRRRSRAPILPIAAGRLPGSYGCSPRTRISL